MKIFEQLWRDVRSGESIDLYATIVIAFVLVALGLFGVASSSIIASLTLTVLGLLAISNLVNRHRVEELINQVAESAKGFFFDEFPTDFKENFESAREIWLVGVTLRGTVRNYYGLIEEKLRKGHHFKVLLVHPEGIAIEIAAGRYYAPTGRDAGRRGLQVRDSLASLCGLRQIAPDKLEIRTIQNPLTFGAVCMNPETTSGILYLEHFPFRIVAGSMPKFVLRAADGRWYDFFKKEVQTLWEEGTEWNCENTE